MQPRTNALTRAVTTAYRRGYIPPKGYGKLFSRTPAWLWGGADVIARTDIGDLAVPIRDLGARQMLVFGRILHEEGETAVMRRLLPTISVFFDVGANYGWYARLAHDLNPRGKVVAVEANPHLVPYLIHNVGPSVEVFNVAAADQAGQVTFYIADNSSLSSPNRNVGRPVTVPSTTLDDISDQVGVTPELVKCDVEGGELAVLRGAGRVRAVARPPIWLIEADEDYLEQAGLSYADLHQELSRFGPVTYWQAKRRGDVTPLPSLESLRGRVSVNVFVVPESRAAVWGAAVKTRGC